jgi:hypothetical protein
MELEERSPAPIARALGLGRLIFLLAGSIVGIAGFWHVMYGVSLLFAIAVVAEIAVMLILAFAYAWRSAR